MKKNRIVFTLVVIISIAYFSLGCGNDTKQNDTNSKQTSVTVEKSVFKKSDILRQNNVTEHFVFTLPLKIQKK